MQCISANQLWSDLIYPKRSLITFQLLSFRSQPVGIFKDMQCLEVIERKLSCIERKNHSEHDQ